MNRKISETNTENIFRAFYGVNIFLEKSAIPTECGFQSKKRNGKEGYPDFFLDETNYVIIVEAKATNHEQAKSEVQFYMEHNNIIKDSIGIAISGQTNETLIVTYFLYLYDYKKIVELNVDGQLLSLDNIKKIYLKSKKAEITTVEHLTKTIHSLNKQFQNENIVRDTDRSLFFSGIMIALKDMTFRKTYRTIQEPSFEEASAARVKMLSAHNLNDAIVSAITRQLKSKINNLSKEYKRNIIGKISLALLRRLTIRLLNINASL